MKKTIQLNGIDPVIFAGVNDQNIKWTAIDIDGNIIEDYEISDNDSR